MKRGVKNFFEGTLNRFAVEQKKSKYGKVNI